MIKQAQWSIALLTLVGASACSSGGGPVSDGPPTVAEAPRKAGTTWSARMVTASQLVVAEVQANEPTGPQRVFLVDLGDGHLQDSMHVPTRYRHVELLDSASRLHLIADRAPTDWNFSIADEAMTGISDAGNQVTVAAIGISELHHDKGWDVEALMSRKTDDAQELLRATRLDPVQEQVTVVSCPSGGRGSVGCGTGKEGRSCSITCRSTHYACCDASGTDCRCLPIEQ